MTKLFWAVSAVLLSAVMTFGQIAGGGQGQDDHDDNGPVQVGYAVVTPAATGLPGLNVAESFGLRRVGETPQTGILPPPLTTSAMLFVDNSSRLSKNLGVAIVNPNNASADVTFTLRKSDGIPLATKTINVATRRQVVQFVTELFPPPAPGSFNGGTPLPAEFTGTLVIDSNMPVAIIGLRFRGLNFSTMPITAITTFTGSFPTLGIGVGGTGAALLPVFVAGGGWASEIIISNTSTTSLTVRLDLFKQDGTPLTTALNGQNGSSFPNLTIPAFGVLVLAPRDRNGDDDF